ncbi:unnamed protein product [Trifolium pratense]|uniref:Uncharacterized protein n=1 Tax=Trifolium pratense TaxID=57577 RepID=A0ACB0K9J3_TRIPR|nr:unnamed protein product [Trifolium pratense]
MNIMFRRDIDNRLNDITRRFDQITESKNKFLLRESVRVRERPTEVDEWHQTSSLVVEPKVYGREDDKEKIVKFLLAQVRDSEFLSVYLIVGLGGVGKTTLAQVVYNDVRVTEKCDALDLDVIQRKVPEGLQGKRYSLVLDDVCRKNQQFEFGLSQEKWNSLKYVLSCGSKGSSILVSTRDEGVATLMGTCKPHHLSGLSDNECWLLFKQYAFRQDREERAEIVTIGKEIVKKCGGLLLAAQALGGLMHSRSGEKGWLEIKDNKLWALPHGNFIFPALSLSYSHLTPTLKQCFAFCAVFPKGMKMIKEELIHIWMANGFISSRENLEVEDVGSMIWNELCQKSFFQDIETSDYSNIIFFMMHDIVHDLAQSIMGQECVCLENANMTKLSKSTHHVTFRDVRIKSLDSLDEGTFKKIESLRTLIQTEYQGTKNPDYFPTNCSLRVLCTVFFPLSSLGTLIHLRCLELYAFDIKIFPNSIYNLKKLEILKLAGCNKLSCLPKNLTCLQNLRHIVIENCYSMTHMFPYIGKLSKLRTLSLYIVRSERGHSLAELRDLNLEGKLDILGLNNVGSLFEAQEANLIGKKDLNELCLSWTSKGIFTGGTTPTLSAEQLLKVLQPQTNLKRLTINYYKGLCFPSMITILSSLVTLELRGCRCVNVLPLGKLPSLISLKLFEMDSVKYMDDDGSPNAMEVRVFSSLRVLVLEGLPNLEWILKVERMEMFPCLSTLRIEYCPKLELPCLPSVKNLHVHACNNEVLRSISSFYGLTTLHLRRMEGITSFPEGMLKNLNCLQTLEVRHFPKLKELPNKSFNLTLERLDISYCDELESLPEQIWEGLQSLQTMCISYCKGLRFFPEGIRHLTSLEVLIVTQCSTLKERCTEGTGEDWDKIRHIPKLFIH